MKKPLNRASVSNDGKAVASATQPEPWGPECGGEGGVRYEVYAQASDRIKKVTIQHREFVDAIVLETEQGALAKIGNPNRHRDVHEETFALGPDEYLTGITVEYWRYLDRISFHTNQRTFGPFGGTGGRLKKTLLAPPDRRLAGFTGRHWVFVDSIRLMIA